MSLPKKFVADAMVGSLARWLRAIGYDTVYLKDVPDREVVARSIKDNRTILTRDHHFEQMKAVKYLILIQSTRLNQQFRQVVETLKLDTDKHLFTRCVECNGILKSVEKSDIQNSVPSFVYKTQDTFSQCPHCERIYWAGTHLSQMQKKIQSMLKSSTLE